MSAVSQNCEVTGRKLCEMRHSENDSMTSNTHHYKYVCEWAELGVFNIPLHIHTHVICHSWYECYQTINCTATDQQTHNEREKKAHKKQTKLVTKKHAKITHKPKSETTTCKNCWYERAYDCVQLWYTAQNNSDNLLLYHSDDHHSSDVVYLRGGSHILRNGSKNIYILQKTFVTYEVASQQWPESESSVIC